MTIEERKSMIGLRLSLLAGAALSVVASTSAGAQTAQSSPAQQASTEDSRTEDIVVTAQRREQTLLEVPQSISVLGGAELERQQATNFLDYAKLVPGLTVQQDNPGQSRLILRGINTGSVGSTVAVYVDDIPFGASGSLSNAAAQSGDFDTFDVARIEVLRGPQGTLYGSNSLGGVLKYITAEPRTDRFEARGQAGIQDASSGGAGYFGNAVINIPLGDTLAFRASGFYRSDDGYIDATGRAGRNINGDQQYGGRASLLFKPSDRFLVRLTGIFQNIDVDSPSSFEVDPATLRPINAVTGVIGNKNNLTRYERYPDSRASRYRVYSGTVSYDFGPAALTSVTSYAQQKQLSLTDSSTNAAQALANAIYAPTAPNTVGFTYQNDNSVKKFTQELRLASSDSDTFEWLVGGYYTNEKTNLAQEYLPFTLATQRLIPPANSFLGTPVPFFVIAGISGKYREYAGFANATLHFGERFDLTGGLRYSHNEQSSSQFVYQLAVAPAQFGESNEGVLTWNVSPRFELSDNASIYARVAKGYRPGGPNFIPVGAAANFPREFDSDTLINYEAGIKAQTPDRTFGIDLSGFYIDWKDILILTTAQSAAGPVGVNANGRRARSYGFEATATVRPTAGLSLVGNVAYTKANLRDDTTSAAGGLNLVGGLRGDPLPFVPRYTANVSADYEWTLAGTANAFIGGDVSLTGDRPGGFDAAYRAAFGRQVNLDGYATVDLRAGVNIGGFTIKAYAKNLLNEYGLVNVGGYPLAVPVNLGGTNTQTARASIIRPRTIGAAVGFAF